MSQENDNNKDSSEKMLGEEKCVLVMEKLYVLNANITWKKYEGSSEEVFKL